MKTTASIRIALALALCAAPFGASRAQVTLNIDASQRGATIGDRHYGIFFEEINHAGDGGIYAELIRNRSFEDNTSSPDYWSTIGSATAAIVSDDLLNDAQECALELTLTQSGDGIRNEGFWGINAVTGQSYKLSFWLKGEPSYSGTLTAELQNDEGESLGSTEINVDASDEWAKYSAEITATGDDTEAYLALTGSKPGTLRLDVVSLFPPTYNNRDNGCRPDLVEMLIAMKPAFMRFPGGCYVEGYYNDDKTNRFEWKNTIGPIEERPGHYNVNWGYRVSDGFGFHEMLQLAEDIGAEPLFVVNIGLGHSWMEEYTQIDEYIQEALDALEYCNGDTTTTWGALRAQNGHPEPFNLRLMEIGNENYNYTFDSNSDQSDHYPERYEQFRQAINAQYPEVELIGNVESWSTDNPSWRNSYQVDLVDEHYYRDPAWMTGKYNKYDSYNRSNYKIYVGEYAVTSDYGTNGNLNAALGEAVFMLGMENNADVCVMNSYAPLFVNENNYNWKPDLIRFNSSTAYGTPSYYVQQLFPNNIGKQNVTWTEEGNTTAAASFKTGLSTWSTAATYDNYTLTDADGNTIYTTTFSSSDDTWTGGNEGNWTISNETLRQTSTSMQGDIYVCNTNVGDNYTLEVEATKTSGDEGFLIVFNYQDDNNYCWWNLGGWGNTAHGVEICTDGSKTTAASVSASIVTGQTYSIKIEVNGEEVKCWLDGSLIHTITLPVERNIYTAASIDDDEGILYLKLVNPSETAQTIHINLTGATVTDATAIVMSGTTGYEENDIDNPNNITPTETTLNASGTSFTYDATAYSLNILRLAVTNITITQEDTATLPDPIIQYSFENGATDDTGTYPATLIADATIVTMNDGNHALYNGYGSQEAYLDLGTDMPEDIFPTLSDAYSLSLDIALPTGSLTNEYAWALSFAQDSDNRIGIYQGPDNTYWYYTVVDNGTSADLTTPGGLSYDTWHNITYVQDNNNATLYIDANAVSQQTETLTPSNIANLASAYIGRSHANTTETMTNAYFDNLRIYNQALTDAQIEQLYNQAATLSPASAQVTAQADQEQLSSLLTPLNYLHASLSLPAQTDKGTNVTWAFQPSDDNASNYIVLSNTELTVRALPDTALNAGTLTTMTDDGSVNISHTVTLAPDDKGYGYLFCYMNSEEETVNFALGSKEDEGKAFYELLEGADVIENAEKEGEAGSGEDPYIGRGEGNEGYFITTSALRDEEEEKDYNYGINLMHSSDLIHWESTTFDFRQGKEIFSDRNIEGYYQNNDYANICRVGAPGFIYDEKEKSYIVYYTLCTTDDEDYDRIFYSVTDNTFSTLTQPQLLYDAGYGVTDADILFNPYDSLYHIFYLNEDSAHICQATSPSLIDGERNVTLHITDEETTETEAPATLRPINQDSYNLYYISSDGMNVCELDNMGGNAGYFSALEGTGSFGHGSFMPLTEDEYTMLQAWSNVVLYLPTVDSLANVSGSSVFSQAIEEANEALALTTVEELAAALPEVYETLKNCYYDYIAELALNTAEGDTLDLTFLLTNPDFSDGDEGWNGTDFTQATSGVAEFFNKTYNTYQVLKNMPAATYVLQCQGFYRYGSYPDAYTAHQNGTEELLAKLYLNDQQASFMSLFDSSAPYTYSPYTYPDGVDGANEAFNTDNAYTGNEVSCTLEATGTLKVGLCKTEAVTYDWNCFDNFKLLLIGGTATGIDEVGIDAADAAVTDVYTLSGIKIRSGVPVSEALNGLKKGIYIVGKEKKVVK